MTSKADVERVSDEEMEDMFTEAYESQVASYNEIGSYECSCKRDSSNPDVKIEVMIVGLAGTPTLDDYKNGKVENGSSVVIKREEKDSLKFELVPKEVITLNTNDYFVTYKLV